MKARYSFLLRLLFPVPFILGVIGYRLAGFSFNDAFYGSFCFYFVSVYSKAYNPIMEIARWTAPLMTVSWLVMSLRGVFAYAKSVITSRRRDSVAIYCDSDSAEVGLLSSGIPRSYVEVIDDDGTPKIAGRSRESIVFMSDDRRSLEFFNRNADRLSSSKVHIILRDLDPVNLKSVGASFFCLPKQIALDLWMKHPLIKKDEPLKRSYKVAIIGSGSMSEQILSYGLSLNIFSEDQVIEYHTYGNWDLFKTMHSGLDLMNGDSITCHDKSWCLSLDELSEMDRIIISEEDNARILEAVMAVCRNSDIYYYSRSNENPSEFYSSDRIHDFGTEAKILIPDNILCDHVDQMAAALYRISRDRNLKISRKTLSDSATGPEWTGLSGEEKREHQLRAYFYELYSSLIADGIPMAENPFSIAPLEHIRWCRTRFLALWQYGVPEDGSYGDIAGRIHKGLVPYEELPEEAADEELAHIIFMMHSFRTIREDKLDQ